MVMELKNLLNNIDAGADLLAMLSHPARFRILYFIANREVCVSDIVDVIGMSQSSVSIQLGELSKRRLVTKRRDARTIFYTCEHSGVLLLMGEIVRLFPMCRPTFSRHNKRQKRSGE